MPKCCNLKLIRQNCLTKIPCLLLFYTILSGKIYILSDFKSYYFMEEFKGIILVGGLIAVLILLSFIFLLKRFEKKHPELRSENISVELRNKYHNLVITLLGAAICCVLLFFGFIFYLAHYYFGLIFLGIVGLFFVLLCLQGRRK